MKWSITIAVVLLVGIAISIKCGYLSRESVRQWRLAHTDGRARYNLIERYSLELQLGMQKEVVERLLGLPDNRDNEYVWYWCCDLASREQYDTWGDLDRYGKGLKAFILFDAKGKLLFPGILKGVGESPWDTYWGFLADGSGRFTLNEAKKYTESLLGSDPYADIMIQSDHGGGSSNE